MKTILLVGDTPLLTRCKVLLEKYGGRYSDSLVDLRVLHTNDTNTELLALLNASKPDIVLYDVTFGTPADPSKDAITAFAINSGTASRVALYCRMTDAHMWMVSDASVFPGKGLSADSDVPFPVHAFGLSRMLGERGVRSLSPDATIVRVGWLYGPEMPDSPPMLAEDTYAGSRSVVHVQAGIIGSPTYIGDAARVLSSNILSVFLVSLVGDYMTGGIFHMAPTRATDWYGILSDEYPKVEATNIKASREIYTGVRNASLIPSTGWEIEEGGLSRFQEEIRGHS